MSFDVVATETTIILTIHENEMRIEFRSWQCARSLYPSVFAHISHNLIHVSTSAKSISMYCVMLSEYLVPLQLWNRNTRSTMRQIQCLLSVTSERKMRKTLVAVCSSDGTDQNHLSNICTWSLFKGYHFFSIHSFILIECEFETNEIIFVRTLDFFTAFNFRMRFNAIN